MVEIVEWLIEIPVICLIGLVYVIALLMLPISWEIEYRVWVKRYGKETANEIIRRF